LPKNRWPLLKAGRGKEVEGSFLGDFRGRVKTKKAVRLKIKPQIKKTVPIHLTQGNLEA
jgi:hypothetical protein